MAKVNKTYLTELIKEVLSEKKADRCLRIARTKYDKSSAYRSGAIVRCRKGEIWKDLKEDVMSETMTVYRLGEIPYDEESFFVTPDYKTWIKFYPGEEIHKITTNKLYLPLRSKSFLSWDELRSKYDLGEFTDDDVSYINPEESGIQDFEQYEIKPDDIINLEQINLKEADDPQAGKAAPYGSGYAKVRQAVQELLQEDETLHKWFSRKGAKGKSKGWVDCNAPDGKGGYKSCGRQEGEKRSKYPACRPTPAQCKTKGKGKTWGKTK